MMLRRKRRVPCRELSVDRLTARTMTVRTLVMPAPKSPGRFDVRFGLPMAKKKEIDTMIEVTLTNEQKVQATIAPKTATGKPAVLDGAPTWEVQSGAGTVEVADDGLSAFLVSSDDPGDTVVLVSADAKVGPEVQTISDIITVHVEGALAENLGLTLGAPVAKA